MTEVCPSFVHYRSLRTAAAAERRSTASKVQSQSEQNLASHAAGRNREVSKKSSLSPPESPGLTRPPRLQTLQCQRRSKRRSGEKAKFTSDDAILAADGKVPSIFRKFGRPDRVPLLARRAGSGLPIVRLCPARL